MQSGSPKLITVAKQKHSSNRWRLLLLISAGLNVALIVWVIALQNLKRAARSAHLPTNATMVVDALVLPDLPQNPDGDAINRVFGWENIASTNFHEYSAHLKAMNCPDYLLRSILDAEIGRAYFPALRILYPQQVGDYWSRAVEIKRRVRQPLPAAQQEATRQLDALIKQRNQLLNELANGDSNRRRQRDRYPDGNNDLERLGFLSEEQRSRILEQEKALDQLRNDLRSKRVPEPEVRAQIEMLRAQQDLERTQFLTLEELAELSLRNSGSADFPRRLYGFEPSTEEYRAIVALHETHQGKVPNDEWSKLFTGERLEAFQRARDEEFRTMSQVTERLNLPDTTSTEVFETKRQSEAAAAEIRASATLSVEEKAAVLSEIRLETENTLQGLLGPGGLKMYRKHGARWLREAFNASTEK